MNHGMVCEIGMRPRGLEIEDWSVVPQSADFIDRKEVKGTTKWNTDKMSSREVTCGNEVRLIDAGSHSGENGVPGRGLKRCQHTRRDMDELSLVVMAEDPAHIVLATILSGRAQTGPRPAPPRIAFWVRE